jgi:VanZ family protein
MLMIFVMSSSAGRGENSMGMVAWFLQKVTPFYYSNLNNYQLAAHNYMFRKACHFTEYFILTLLVVRAIQFGRAELKASAFFGAAALSIVYAMTDELHQMFVAGRVASTTDVLVDASGALFCLPGILGFFAMKRLERRLLRGPSRTDEHA